MFEHATYVGLGNLPYRFAAICDPPPLKDDDPFCWQGPDRSTFEEAVADARLHFDDAPLIDFDEFDMEDLRQAVRQAGAS